MTYPLLRISGDYARVIVRVGNRAARWKDMEQIHDGPADAGTEWKGAEGQKLSGKHCMWPDDPNSSMSLPHSAYGLSGLGAGEPELKVFPDW